MDAHAGEFVGNNVGMRKVFSMQVKCLIVKILQIKAVSGSLKTAEDPSVGVFVCGDSYQILGFGAHFGEGVPDRGCRWGHGGGTRPLGPGSGRDVAGDGFSKLFMDGKRSVRDEGRVVGENEVPVLAGPPEILSFGVGVFLGVREEAGSGEIE